MNPILLDIPAKFETPRLILRASQAGDGAEVNAGILETFDELHKWVPFATHRHTLEESEERARRAAARWITREDFLLMIFEKKSGAFVGNVGLHRPDWKTAKQELGYWGRQSFAGNGYMTEAANALTRFAFEKLGARRVEAHCDRLNARSCAVVERLGFEREGVLKLAHVNPNGVVGDTVVYARFSPDGLPELAVSWSFGTS